MTAYTMPDWLYSLTGVLSGYGLASLARGKPQTLLESLSLRAASLLLKFTHQAGVWGRL